MKHKLSNHTLKNGRSKPWKILPLLILHKDLEKSSCRVGSGAVITQDILENKSENIEMELADHYHITQTYSPPAYLTDWILHYNNNNMCIVGMTDIIILPGFADTTGSRQRFTNRAIKNKNKYVKDEFRLVCPHTNECWSQPWKWLSFSLLEPNRKQNSLPYRHKLAVDEGRHRQETIAKATRQVVVRWFLFVVWNWGFWKKGWGRLTSPTPLLQYGGHRFNLEFGRLSRRIQLFHHDERAFFHKISRLNSGTKQWPQSFLKEGTQLLFKTNILRVREASVFLLCGLTSENGTELYVLNLIWVWLNRSPIPVGRGAISSFKWFLPAFPHVGGGGGSAPCGTDLIGWPWSPGIRPWLRGRPCCDAWPDAAPRLPRKDT